MIYFNLHHNLSDLSLLPPSDYTRDLNHINSLDLCNALVLTFMVSNTLGPIPQISFRESQPVTSATENCTNINSEPKQTGTTSAYI